MSLIAHELAETLRTIRRPGDFYTSGTAEIFAPRLEVDGVGPIALPLLPVQAEQLIAVAEQAPTAVAKKPWSIPPCGAPGRSTPTESASEAGIGRTTWRPSSPAPPLAWG